MAKFSFLTGTAAAVLALAAASCSSESSEKASGVIDVAGAVAQAQDLKVSDLGKTIKYVPLETTDSSLVSDKFVLVAGDGAFLVANVGSEFGGGEISCLSFGTDGKFIARVGHLGQDPESYWYPLPIMAPDYKSAYFFGQNMQHYAFDGSYLGKSPRDGFIGYPGVSVAVDTMFIAVRNSRVGKYGPRVFSIYAEGFNSTVVDTTDVIPYPSDQDGGPVMYNELRIYNPKGIMRNGRTSYQEYREGNSVTYQGGRNLESVWRVGKEAVHHRGVLNDTVFAITPTSAEIAYIFDCGEGRLTQQLLEKQEEMPSSSLFVTDIVETSDRIVFAASRGWIRADHTPYVGIYDKKTGETRAGDGYKGFVDDLTGFISFYPITALPDGRLVGLITMDDIDKYLEENPDAKVPAEIAELEEDANPILVIVGD